MENNNNDRKMFITVLGIATLIVSILGATFAYFSAQTNSEANAVGAGAAEAPSLSLESYPVHNNINTNMIPATENIATYAAFVKVQGVESEYCLDDNGNEVCSIYDFELVNTSDISQTVNVTLTTTYLNKFTNLSYKVYKSGVFSLRNMYTTSQSIFNSPDLVFSHTAGGDLVPALNGADTIDSQIVLGPYKSGTEGVEYTIVIWLNETNTNQNAEAGGSWSATINATTGTGTGVTGVIDFNRPASSSSSSSSSGNTR